MEAAGQAGLFIDVARLLLEQGRPEEAAAQLQKITPQHQSFREAKSLLASALWAAGEREHALCAARQAVEGLEVAPENLEFFYRLAGLLEEGNTPQQRREARTIYDKIVSVQLDFRDARARRDSLLDDLPAFAAGSGQYEVVKSLGRGGMGEVWLCRIRKAGGFEKLVAMKRLLSGESDNKLLLGALRREIAIASRIEHPHIVSLLDVGMDGEHAFLVFEYVDGCNLAQIYKRQKVAGSPLPPPLAAFIGSRVCNALDYLHRKIIPERRKHGVVHRDISPQNILVSFEGMVKLIDFGIALSELYGEKTEMGIIKGKPRYMSPEQKMGQDIDGRADVYSLGVVLYELLGGQSFSSVSEKRERQGAAPPPLRHLAPQIPLVLEAIVTKALAVEREKRFQSAAEMERELNQYLALLPEPVGQPELAQYLRENFQPPGAVS